MLPMTNDDRIARGAILRSELTTLTSETEAMNKYRSYFEGEQELVYATETFTSIFGDAFDGFRDNWMKVIVNAVRNRLELVNFSFEGDEDSTLSDEVWRVLRLNEIEVQQDDLHEGALVESRAFVIVWPDEQIGATVDWQPGQICRVFYDPQRRTRARWAVRRWTTDEGDVYVNFYTPEFVYKFIDRGKDSATDSTTPSALNEIPGVGWFGGDLEKRLVPNEPWPLPHPFGVVPVIEFNNTGYESEIKDHIPQQDALNKMLLDLLVTSEFQAFPQRVIETMSNAPTGGWKSGPGEVWHFKPSFDSDGKQVQSHFSTFDTANPNNYMEPISMWLQHMALTSSTPVRYFMQSDRGGRGDSPSGEALLVDDKPLNDKVEAKQRRFGSSWMQVARLIVTALTGENAQSLVGESIWRDPRHDYRLAKLEEGKTMADTGFPVEFIATQIGLSPQEERLLLDLIEEDRDRAEEEMQATEVINDSSDTNESQT